MFRITTQHLDAVERRFTAYGLHLADWMPVWAEVIGAFHAEETEWFESEGRGTWKQLDPETAKRKEAEFPGEPILVRTGALKRAAENAEAVPMGNQLDITINNPYAAYHQTGAGNLPQRRVIPPLPETREMVREVAEANADIGP